MMQVMRDNFEYQNFDEETLRRVEHNDPDFRGLTIPNDVDWIEGAGRIIGENTSLRGIQIDVGSDDEETKRWHQELFQGLSRNRSIESLELTFHCDIIPQVDVFHILAPFFENNGNLHYLGINEGWAQIKSLASMLSNCNKTKSQLQCVKIMLGRPHLDEDTESLLNSLRGIHTLVKLELSFGTFGKKGCIALSELLIKSNIHTLGLENSELDEDCTSILSNAMITKNNLTSLSLSSMCEPKSASWQISSTALSNPVCILEKLFLCVTEIDDEGVTTLGDALARNRRLKILDLSVNLYITATGWRGFSKCLRNGNSVLEDLDISACCVDDDGAAAIVDALTGNSSLKRLGMGYNDLITTAGWTSVFHSILNFTPSLEELEVFEDILSENDWTETMDWTILSRALCDSSSIDMTFSSNHTFHSLPGYQGSDLHGAVPDEMLPLLLMNRNEKNKAEVARKKILKCHFAEGKTNVITQMPLTSMPCAIEWIGRGNGELSLMYNVVQESPELFDTNQRPQGGAEVLE